MKTLEQWDLDFDEAIANETRRGLEVINSGETREGAARFAADVCAAYLKMATTGTPDAPTTALLQRSSPAPVLDKIKAPTLLIQGAVDTLFPLSEADANARGIGATGTPVRVAWFTGGHDGGSGPQTDQDRTKFLTAQWLDHYVKKDGAAPATSFTYSRVAGFSALDRGLVTNGYSDPTYPGLTGTGSMDVDWGSAADASSSPGSGVSRPTCSPRSAVRGPGWRPPPAGRPVFGPVARDHHARKRACSTSGGRPSSTPRSSRS